MKKYFLSFILINLYFGALLYPEDGSIMNQIYIKFEWEQEAGNNYYILNVSENQNDIQGDCIVCEQFISGSLIYIEKNLLEWDKTYYWHVISYENNNQGDTIGTASFSTGTQIANATTALYNDNTQAGLTIFGSFFDYYSAVIDEDGNEIWNSGEQDLIFYNTDQYGRFFGAEFIGNNVENNYPGIKFSFDNGIDWQEPGENFIHHDIFQLPNGNYIGLGTSYGQGPIPIGPWTPLFQGLGFEADGETIEFDWMGDKIIEWDADTKEEVWSWDVFDYFNQADYDSLGGIWFEAYNTNRFDWTHANAIWFDEEDSAIYLSSRHLNRITKIAYPSGDVLWNLGHELGSGDIDCGQNIGFSFQHSLQKLNNGNILTFDNGNLSREFLNQDEKTSRSIEIDITETATGCEASLAWEYVLPEELYGYLSGNTQKLDNGNYLSTTIGNGGTSLEVNESGDEIWEANYNLQLPDGLVYRAMKIPGIFPIAYSLIFPQFETSTSYIYMQDEQLEVSIYNNGDYAQLFNYDLQVSQAEDYDIIFTITPEHHPEHTKISTFSLSVAGDNEEFSLTNKTGSFILNANEQIELYFNDMLDTESNNLTTNFLLGNPYPNPFNPIVNFNVAISEMELVKLNIYDIQGNKIQSIYSGVLPKGEYSFNWNGENYASGMYIVKCETNSISQNKKIFLMK